MFDAGLRHLYANAFARHAEVERELAAIAEQAATAHVEVFRRQAALVAEALRRLSKLVERPEPLVDYVYRELQRNLTTLDTLHIIIGKYRRDVHFSHPVGLVYLARVALTDVVGDVIGGKTEMLIRIDAARNYSVENVADLFDDIAPRGGDDGVIGGPVLPVVLGLPALDPYNAFFAPILAHEAAHLVSRSTVMPALIGVDAQTIDERPVAPESRNSRSVDIIVDGWLDELICDSMAMYVAGPSWINAAIAFLGAPSDLDQREHPNANIRLAWAWRLAEVWGWRDYIESHFPAIHVFMEDLNGLPVDESLREYVSAVDALQAAVVSAVEKSGATQFTVERYEEVRSRHEIVDAFAHRFMPPSLADDPPTVWDLLLGAWEAAALEAEGIEFVSEASADPQRNAFLLRAFELVGVTRMWGTS